MYIFLKYFLSILYLKEVCLTVKKIKIKNKINKKYSLF